MNDETEQQTGDIAVGADVIAREYFRLIEDGWSPDLAEYLRRVPEGVRPEVEALIQAELSPHDAGAFAREYLRLVMEGWEPDLEEYVSRVPESVREAVLARIDEAQANPPEVEQAEYLVPAVEVEVPGEELASSDPEAVAIPVVDLVTTIPPGRVGRFLSYFLPASIREVWIGEWAFARQDRRTLGLSAFEVNLLSVQELMDGIAQHAPLRAEPAEPVASAGALARYAWIGWRFSGPLLFAGAAASSLALASAGLVLLGGALGGAVARSEREDADSRRLVNGVLGGLCVTLAAWACLLAVVLPPLLLALALGQASLAAKAFGLLALLAPLALAWVTAKGRAPAPWWPRRLVRLGGRGA